MFPIVGTTHKSQAPNQISLKRSISDLNFEVQAFLGECRALAYLFSFLTPCLHVMDVKTENAFHDYFLIIQKLLSHLNIIILRRICDDTM